MENWIHSDGSYDDIVLNTKIQLIRNFSDLPFVAKLDETIANEHNELLYESVQDEFNDEHINLYSLSEDKTDDYYDYINKELIDKEILNKNNKSAFIINDDHTFTITLNEAEHIKISCISAGLDFEDTFNKANIIDDTIERNYEYAFDEKLGYLTTLPENAGNGFKVKVTVHLPALTMNHTIKQIYENLKKSDIVLQSKYKDDSASYGNVYEIYNINSCKKNEHEIIENLKKAIFDIISEEKKAREILIVKQKYLIMDKIFRSYALLKSAIMLEFKETIEYLSNTRLGAELSLLQVEKNKLNKISTCISNEYIKRKINEQISDEEIKFERANIVRKILA